MFQSSRTSPVFRLICPIAGSSLVALIWYAGGDSVPSSGRDLHELSSPSSNTIGEVPEIKAVSSREAQPPGPSGEAKVSIDNFTFTPATLEIRAGMTVVWVNGDDVPHTVRSTADRFRSEALDTDDKFECVFSEPGTYDYYCGVHPHMTGKVIVK
jgi:plastocyanin